MNKWIYSSTFMFFTSFTNTFTLRANPLFYTVRTNRYVIDWYYRLPAPCETETLTLEIPW